MYKNVCINTLTTMGLNEFHLKSPRKKPFLICLLTHLSRQIRTKSGRLRHNCLCRLAGKSKTSPMISYIIFSLKVKTVKTHAFTSLTYFLNYSCTDVISIHISIYVFSCLVFILFLYKFCKSISRIRIFEKLRVIILELFHPIVH